MFFLLTINNLYQLYKMPKASTEGLLENLQDRFMKPRYKPWKMKFILSFLILSIATLISPTIFPFI